MKIFDVNILIYAHREDQKHHSFYRNWLEATVSSGETFGLTTLVAMGFVRIVTNPRFPYGPTPLAQALAVIDALSGFDNCHWISPGRQHWEIVSRLCRETGSLGKKAADAQHAAIAIEHAGEWVTRDKDFLAFQPHGLRLEWLTPGK